MKVLTFENVFIHFKPPFARYKARNNNGQIGLVPRNYLQELSEYLSQSYRGCPPTGDSIDRRNDQMNNSMSPPPPINANANANANNQMERPNLAGKSWYYGAITRNQCDTVLNSHGHDGDFLIRDSETNVSGPTFPIHLHLCLTVKLNRPSFSFHTITDGRLFGFVESARPQ